jgi:hypothetical protein
LYKGHHVDNIIDTLLYRLAADNDAFKTKCGTLFEKMLNTVPSSVTLTDVIQPIPVKPTSLFLVLMADGRIQVSGEVRVS